MKKKIVFALAVFLMISALAACGREVEVFEGRIPDRPSDSRYSLPIGGRGNYTGQPQQRLDSGTPQSDQSADVVPAPPPDAPNPPDAPSPLDAPNPPDAPNPLPETPLDGTWVSSGGDMTLTFSRDTVVYTDTDGDVGEGTFLLTDNILQAVLYFEEHYRGEVEVFEQRITGRLSDSGNILTIDRSGTFTRQSQQSSIPETPQSGQSAGVAPAPPPAPPAGVAPAPPPEPDLFPDAPGVDDLMFHDFEYGNVRYEWNADTKTFSMFNLVNRRYVMGVEDNRDAQADARATFARIHGYVASAD